jgi:hypothetical protein
VTPAVCPKCRRAHPGRRDLDELRALLLRSVSASMEDDDVKAIERLRSQCHGTALELMNYCPSCKFDELLVPIVERAESVMDAEARMQAVTEPGLAPVIVLRPRPSITVIAGGEG